MMRALLCVLGVDEDEASEVASRVRGQYYLSGPPLRADGFTVDGG